MNKNLLLAAFLSGCLWSAAAADGLVFFGNNLPFNTPAATALNGHNDRLVYASDNITPLTGTNWAAHLYYAAGANMPAHALTPVAGEPSRFRRSTTTYPGTWEPSATSIALPGVLEGQTATLQVRIWDASFFPTYEEAVAGGSPFGLSALFHYTAPAISSVPSAFYMEGLQSFNAGLIDFGGMPVITRQPPSQTHYEGTGMTLDVGATGLPPFAYRWLLENTPLPGATNATLTLTGLTTNQAGNYRVIVSNSLGSRTSSPALLTVLQLDCTPLPSGLVSLWRGENSTADAVGGNHGLPLGSLGYASGKVGQAIALPARSGIRVPSTPSLNVGTGAGLTFEAWIYPTNLAQRGPILEWQSVGYYYTLAGTQLRGGWEGSQWGLDPAQGAGAFYLGLRDTNNLLHTAATATNILTANVWQHVAVTYSKATGVVKLYRNGMLLRTSNIGLFEPQTADDLYLGLHQTDIESFMFPGLLDEVGLYSRPLTDLEIESLFASGAGGKCFSPAAPQLAYQTPGRLSVVGETQEFRVAATGYPAPSHQWFFNGMTIPGAIQAHLALSSVTPAQAGQYTVVASNSLGTVASSNMQLLTISAEALDQALNSALTWRTGGDAPWTVSTVASQDGLSAAGGRITHQQTTWLETTVTGPGTLTFQVKVSSEQYYDYLKLYLGASNVFRASGDYGWTQRSVQIPAGVQTLRWEYAKDQALDWGQDRVWLDQVSYTTDPPVAPRIVQQPTSRTVTAGTSVEFSVLAEGTSPLFYQWRHDGNDIPGATHATLVLVAFTNVAGTYNVTVSNAVGAVTSSDAVLTVTAPPIPRIVVWGNTSYGQSNVPTDLNNVVSIAAGSSHCVAVKADGTLAAWGYNSNGQTAIPPGLNNVIAVSARNHNLALKADGTVVAWGNSLSGQTNVPAGLSNVIAVAAGLGHSLALKADGTVVGWGSNLTGQMQPPTGLSSVAAIAAGHYHSMALKMDGTVAVWGDNTYGQWEIPLDLSHVVAIAAGDYSCLALTAEGRVVAWGNTEPPPAVETSGLTNVVALATSSGHALALKADGSIVGWGSNTLGQASVPPGISNVVAIAAGFRYSMALIADSQPRIAVHPFSQSVYSGKPVLLSVRAISPEPIAFQWQCHGTNLTGETNSVLSMAAGRPDQSGHYRVLVRNASGSVTSSPAVLSISNVPPTLTAHPASQVHYPGGAVAFQIAADGSWPLRYQWSWNGVAIPGATNADLLLTELNTKHVGSYAVDVINSFGQTTSSNAALALSPVAAWGGNSAGQTLVPASATNVVALASGGNHILALRTDGSAVAWGDNAYGQSSIPSGCSNVVALAGGTGFSLALLPNGRVTAWGDGSYGKTNVPAGLSNVVAIACGYTHSLALKADGTVAAWGGKNYFGQALVPAGLSNVALIAAGGDHNMALKADGTVVVWGLGQSGQTNVPAGLSHVVALAGGGAHCLALQMDGTVVAWGDNRDGQCAVPAGLSNVVAIAGGSYHSLALQADGTVVAWGFNRQGQTNVPTDLRNVVALAGGWGPCLALLGNSKPGITIQPLSQTLRDGTTRLLVVKAASPSPLSYQWQRNGLNLAGATDSSLAVSSLSGEYRVIVSNASGSVTSQVATLTVIPLLSSEDTRVLAHGANFYGQATVPLGLSNVVAVAAGASHSLALKANGTVVSWGTTQNGQPQMLTSLSNIIAIAAGLFHNLALKADGTVVAWGDNFGGTTTVPAGLSNVVSIAAGDFLSMALTREGQVVTWGNPHDGRAGVPAGLSSVTAITMGAAHSLALKADGTVAAWGNNDRGQISVPSGLSNVVMVAAGAYHNLALKADGTVVAWGDNLVGSTNVPTNLRNVVAIATGQYSCLALKQDGTVIYWGGQSFIGESAWWTRLSNVIALAPGPDHCLALVGNSLPGITLQPSSQLTYSGQSRTLTVMASGNGSLFFQWQWNGADLVGETNNTLRLPSLQTTQSGSCQVIVSNAFGSITSRAITLTVLDSRPIISSQPSSWAIGLGGPAAFQVYAEGSAPLNYQWYFNRVLIPGATNAAYKISAMASNHVGMYSVVLRNGFGEMTSSNANLELTPVIVLGDSNDNRTVIPLGLSHVVSVAAGGGHNLALKADGTVRAWGLNIHGQTNVPWGLSNVVTIAAGDYHSLALKADGTVAAWGCNSAGQIAVPAGLRNVMAITAGEYHNLALKTDGTVVTWGYSIYGEGDVPTNLHGVIAIAAGKHHSLALKADGAVVAWGDNNSGQTDVPTGLCDVIMVAAGNKHSLALKADGTVVTWGNNVMGSGYVPAGLSNVVMISAGDDQSMALKADGTITAWPYSEHYTFDSPASWSNVIAIAGGGNHGVALTGTGHTVITLQPLSKTLLSGKTGLLTVKAASQYPLMYQWLCNGINLAGETNESLRVYNTPPNSGCYQVVVSDAYDSITSRVATIAFQDSPPVFLSQPAPQALYLGATAVFSASADGSLPLSCQWLYNGSPLPSATNVALTIADVEDSHAGNYSVVVSNTFGSVTSANARLTLKPTLTRLLNVDCGSGYTTTKAGPAAVGINTNDFWNFYTRDVSGYYRYDGTLADLLWADGAPSTLGLIVSNAAGAWANGSPDPMFDTYLYPLASDLILRVTLTNLASGSYDFYCYGHEDSDAKTCSYELLVNGQSLGIKTNGPGLTDPLWKEGAHYVRFAAVTVPGGQNIQCVVRPDTGLAVLSGLQVLELTPPSISQQPVSQTVLQGNPATLSASVSGPASFTYQWKHDGTMLPEATNASLVISSAQPDDAGTYQVTIRNPYGKVVSSNATLTVLAPPTFGQQPLSQRVRKGDTVTFTAAVNPGTFPLFCQWRHNGIHIPGAASVLTESTVSSSLDLDVTLLLLTNVQPSQAGFYSLLVSNAAGSAISLPAELIVITETNRPAIAILSPAPEARFTNASLQVRGTATDAGGLRQVLYQLNGGAFLPASGTTNWTATIQLRPGTNLFLVKSVDRSGNESASARRILFYQTFSRLTVRTNGQGTVFPNLDGKLLVVGQSYTLTATPKAGWLFQCWTGGLTSASPTLAFVMQSNLSLTACFQTNRLPQVAGTYNGLFHEADHIRPESSGAFTLSVLPGGAFTATFRQANRTLMSSGQFLADGTSYRILAPDSTQPLAVTLALDLDGSSVQVTGTVTGNGWVAVLLGDRKVFNGEIPAKRCPFAGHYTVAIPWDDLGGNASGGYGIGQVTVTPGGQVSLSGTLADLTPLTAGGTISQAGAWPLYAPLYNGKGLVLGWLTVLTNSNPDAMLGTLSWIRPKLASRFYPAGLTNEVVLEGSKYSWKAGQRLLDMTAGTLELSGGNLPQGTLTYAVTLRSNNTFAVTGTPAVSLVVTQANGQVTGGFVHPATHQPTGLRTVVLPLQNSVRGQFTGTNGTGSLRISPEL